MTDMPECKHGVPLDTECPTCGQNGSVEMARMKRLVRAYQEENARLREVINIMNFESLSDKETIADLRAENERLRVQGDKKEADATYWREQVETR